MLVSEVQLAKALLPMLDTLLSGSKLTLFNAVQPWNVVPWIVVVSPPITRVFRAPKLWNGCSLFIGTGIHVAAHIDVLDAVDGDTSFGTGTKGGDLHHNSVLAFSDDKAFQVRAVRKLLTHGLAPARNNRDFLKAGTAVEHAGTDVVRC